MGCPYVKSCKHLPAAVPALLPPLGAGGPAELLADVVQCGCSEAYCSAACLGAAATRSTTASCAPRAPRQPQARARARARMGLGRTGRRRGRAGTPWRACKRSRCEQTNRPTNEIFLLAARGFATVACRFEASGGDLHAALLPFAAFRNAPWWAVVPTPGEAGREGGRDG
jgi:hypothetical protein